MKLNCNLLYIITAVCIYTYHVHTSGHARVVEVQQLKGHGANDRQHAGVPIRADRAQQGNDARGLQREGRRPRLRGQVGDHAHNAGDPGLPAGGDLLRAHGGVKLGGGGEGGGGSGGCGGKLRVGGVEWGGPPMQSPPPAPPRSHDIARSPKRGYRPRSAWVEGSFI